MVVSPLLRCRLVFLSHSTSRWSLSRSYLFLPRSPSLQPSSSLERLVTLLRPISSFLDERFSFSASKRDLHHYYLRQPLAPIVFAGIYTCSPGLIVLCSLHQSPSSSPNLPTIRSCSAPRFSCFSGSPCGQLHMAIILRSGVGDWRGYDNSPSARSPAGEELLATTAN